MFSIYLASIWSICQLTNHSYIIHFERGVDLQSLFMYIRTLDFSSVLLASCTSTTTYTIHLEIKLINITFRLQCNYTHLRVRPSITHTLIPYWDAKIHFHWWNSNLRIVKKKFTSQRAKSNFHTHTSKSRTHTHLHHPAHPLWATLWYILCNSLSDLYPANSYFFMPALWD